MPTEEAVALECDAPTALVASRPSRDASGTISALSSFSANDNRVVGRKVKVA